MAIKINIINSSNFKCIPRKRIKAIVNAIFSDYGYKDAQLSLIIVDNKEIKRINKKFLNHNYPTDVICFSLADNDEIDGEAYISIDIAKKQALEYDVPLRDELMRYAAHAALHLCGLDDASSDERKNMNEIESKYIKIINHSL
ncbi:MAG TPA: rRNA maturation RNase YbeY [Candidatus Kapabacteria bacterium]|nr:rRNA maturation RNase YbeY [Candidatus Kapabacteria bacterium]